MTTRVRSRPFRWGRVIVISFVLLLLVGLLLHWMWTIGARRRLDAQVAVYRAGGEPIEPADFTVAGVADVDNAALDLRAAHAAIDRDSEAWIAFDKLDEGPALPLRPDELALIRQLVSANGGVFPKVASATTKPAVDWQIVFTTPVWLTLLPDLKDQRELARFLRADALLAHTEGDHARAVRRASEILFQSRALGKQPLLVPSLVSIGLSAMASELAADMAPDLRIGGSEPGAATAQQVRELIAQLLDESALVESQRNGLLGERMAQLEIARTFNMGIMGSINASAAAPANGNPFAGAVLKPAALRDGVLMIRHTTAVMEAAGSESWPEFMQKAPVFPAAVTEKPWLHLVASIFMPSLDRAVLTHYRARIDRRMAAVVLALRLYASEHDGELPTTLSQLVPAYLPAVPLDAMSATPRPLTYIAGDDPVVYSVGENGIDDGGSEQAATSRPSYYQLSKWERLDTVQHYNRQPRPLPEPAYDDMEAYDEMEELSTEPATEPSTVPVEP